MSDSEDQSGSFKTLLTKLFTTPEFAEKVEFKAYDLFSVRLDNANLRRALIDYFASLNLDETIPLRQTKSGSLGSRDVFILDAPVGEGEQFAREFEALQEYVRLHILGQRISDAEQRFSCKLAYAVDEDTLKGGSYLKFENGLVAKEVSEVLKTMLKNAHQSASSMRQVAEIRTDDAVILSAHVPIQHRSLFSANAKTIQWLNGLESKDFFTQFDQALAQNVAKAKGGRA